MDQATIGPAEKAKTKIAVAKNSDKAARIVSGLTASSVLPKANLLRGIAED